MKNEKILKLTLYKDFKEVKTIVESSANEGYIHIQNIAEKWKAEDIKRNFCPELLVRLPPP